MANLNVLPQVQPAKVETAPLSDVKENAIQQDVAKKEFEKELATAVQTDGSLLAMIQPQPIAQPFEPISMVKASAEESIVPEKAVPVTQKESKNKSPNVIPALPLQAEPMAPQAPTDAKAISNPSVQNTSAKQPQIKAEVKTETKAGPKTAPKTAPNGAPITVKDSISTAQHEQIKTMIPALSVAAGTVKPKSAAPLNKKDSIEGVSTEALPLKNELNVQSLEVHAPSEGHPFAVSSPEPKKPTQKGAHEALNPTMPKTSMPSTNEYLSLRNSLKRPKGEESLRTEGTIQQPAHHALTMAQPASMMAPIVDAHTTQGSQGKTILSHDAIDRLTHHVSLLNQAKLDGEIKIRLKPDHLGELQMSVKAQGQQVSIQIKTANGEAKRIIEESMSSLKDSLSQQNLNLSQVDVVSQPNATHSSTSDAFHSMDSQKQQHGAFDQQQQSREDRFVNERPEPRKSNVSQIPTRPSRGSRTNQGLDLIA